MSGMFKDAKAFNGDIDDWDVSKVTDFSHMFEGAESFNSQVTNWDVTAATDMTAMFKNAKTFNKNLSWNTSKLGFSRWADHTFATVSWFLPYRVFPIFLCALVQHRNKTSDFHGLHV